MELERKTIEKQDFSSSRRGYDQAEVDRHLNSIADAVEQLKRSSTAGTAAERVKGIIEAAERSAAEIESAARENAGTAGEELADAERRREQAESEADEQLRRAEEAAGLLEQALAELERVRSALAALAKAAPPADAPKAAPSGDAPKAAPPAETPKAASPARKPRAASPAKKSKAAPPAKAAKAAPPADAPRATPPADARSASRAKTTILDEPAPSAAGEREPASTPPGGEGARLIALNMALNGTPREETARYLAENFDLDDPDALLDDVYSRAGG